MGLSLSGPAALWGFKPLRSFSMPWAETWILGIGGYGLGWNGRFIPESCKSCRVLWARCLTCWALGAKHRVKIVQ